MSPGFRTGHIAIVGRPSVGKSTLLNRLIGHKLSITSRKPQTTRHRIHGILTAADAQYVFVDTPGFQTRFQSRLNERMNRAVRDVLAGVDVVVWVIDAAGLQEGDRAVLRLVPPDVPTIAAINKVDRVGDKAALMTRIAELAALRDFAAIVPVSAEKGTQVDALLGEIRQRLPEGAPLHPEDELTDRDERFLAAEFVREKIFRQLGDEVPYSCAVGIDRFEHEGELRRIHATIYVDKAGQRAILLGARGERMKAIATQARQEMQSLFGGTVFLDVWIKVKPGWGDSDALLNQLGY